MPLVIHTNVTSENQKRFGIYALKCIPTGKVYIGQAARPFIQRWMEHQGNLYKQRHNKYLQNAYNKYGIQNFEFEVIEYMPNELELLNIKRLKEIEDEKIYLTDNERKSIFDWLNERETFYVRKHRNEFGYRSVFNSNDGGTGLNPTPEVRYKMSESQKQREHGPLLKLRGRIKPEEECKHISDGLKKWHTVEENRKRKSEFLKGRKISEQGKQNMSLAQKKHFSSEENRNKKRIEQKEYWTNDKRIKKSISVKQQYKDNPEIKKQLSSSVKELWKSEHYRNLIRKTRYSYIERAMDDILHDVYLLKPSWKKKSIYKKLQIINEISELLKTTK